MPNDQFGKPVSVGDAVIIKGEVTKVDDDPNFINCTVKLAEPMPPSGTEVSIQINTAQVTKVGGDGGGGAKAGGPLRPPGPQHAEQQQPQHAAKK